MCLYLYFSAALYIGRAATSVLIGISELVVIEQQKDVFLPRRRLYHADVFGQHDDKELGMSSKMFQIDFH